MTNYKILAAELGDQHGKLVKDSEERRLDVFKRTVSVSKSKRGKCCQFRLLV